MATPSGLPKVGEIWTRTTKLPPDWKPHVTVFKVLERGRGDYWAMRVRIISYDEKPPDEFHKVQFWVDCAYWMSRGELQEVK